VGDSELGGTVLEVGGSAGERKAWRVCPEVAPALSWARAVQKGQEEFQEGTRKQSHRICRK
jgi:hypothetical protein